MGSVPPGKFSGDGRNSFTDLLYSAVKKGWPGFDYEALDAELGAKSLRLQALFGVVRGEQSLGKSAIAFTDIDN